ncbi:MAG: SDR family NAD(P)-dependent oxidoreductase [Bacteroidota bacterium]
MTDRPIALITGGSSGIGLALSRRFARAGYCLLWVGMDAEEMQQAAKRLQQAHPDALLAQLHLDLSQSAAAEQVYHWVHDMDISLDVLINNAGFGTSGYLPEIEREREQAMIRLHISTLHDLTMRFLADMLAHNHGNIINLASISAYQACPYLTTYAATKAFVKNFSEGLNYELKDKGSKVRVTAVCPTPVRTGFAKAADMEDSQLFTSWMVVSAEKVADAAFRAMQKGKGVTIPGRGFALLNSFIARLPMSWRVAFAARSI